MKGLYLFIIILGLIISGNIAQAQIGMAIKPISDDQTLIGRLQQIPFEKMVSVDKEKLLAEDAKNDLKKDRPWRFGENLEVKINPQNSGVWDEIPFGGKLWRVGIECPNALSINIAFDKYKLPKDALLWVYDIDKKQIIGAFSDFNNQEDQQFATTLIFSSSIIIEYYQPENVEYEGELNIFRVTHGYRGVGEYIKGLNTSGSCNNNVNCPEAVNWQDEKRGVAMLVSNGNGFCSGSLINNTSNDGTPYLLTANHCYSDPGTWVFWFNWESPTCANPTTSPAHDNMSGATLKARKTDSDFCLVQLNQSIPESYNVYFNGWDRTNTPSTSSVSIHHPDGDIKKISYDNNPCTSSDYEPSAYLPDSHWKITQWDDGTTEGGSSGSPLFNQNHHIIGQLHGGWASCTSLTADFYGKFSMSWDRGTTAATRLKDWLDPSGSNVTTLDAYDPNAIALNDDAQMFSIVTPVESYLSLETVTPQVIFKNRGLNNITSATISYTLNGGTPVTKSWTGTLESGNTVTIDFLPFTLTAGDHVFVATVTIPNDENMLNNTITRNFTVIDCGSARPLPFVELFENETFPPLCWVTYRGTNGLGTGYDWTTTTSSPIQGTKSAFIRYETVTGGNAQDWMVTPALQLGPESNKLSYWEKQGYSNTYNSTYSIRVSTSSQTNISDFTTVESYTESGWGTTARRHIIDLSAYNNQPIYIAFVMENNNGDNWIVDSVKVWNIAPLYAQFSGNPTTVNIMENVTFTDYSGGETITSWDWNFGEGAEPATANTKGPHIVTYSTQGLKTVSLTVNGTATETKTEYITVLNTPTIIVDQTQINFGDVIVNNTSDVFTFNVSGLLLTDDIVITSPANFQIKTTSGTNFTNSINLSPTSGSVANTEIQVIFTPDAVQPYSGSITIESNGATSKNIALTGNGLAAPVPTINLSINSLTFPDTEVGTISNELTYTVTGTDLTNNITIDAPLGFSITTTTGTGYTNQVSLPNTNGNIPATTIYVVFNPTVETLYNDAISHTSTNAITQNLSVSGNAVPVSIGKINSSKTRIYPNPTNGILNISIDNTSSKFTVTINEISGKQVYQNKWNGNNASIDAGFLTKGLYIIRVETENEVTNYPVILE